MADLFFLINILQRILFAERSVNWPDDLKIFFLSSSNKRQLGIGLVGLSYPLIFSNHATFSGALITDYTKATNLDNNYKEVIDHVWQIVYRDFLDSSGKFDRSTWINIRKDFLSKKYIYQINTSKKPMPFLKVNISFNF